MKLGKTSWLILIAGITVMLFAILGVTLFQQENERQQLNEDLTMARQRLGKVQLEPLLTREGRLEGQLGQVLLEFESDRSARYQSIESMEIIDMLFGIAGTARGIEITEVNLSGVTTSQLGGVSLSAVQLSLEVEGSLPAVIRFIAILNRGFISGIVRSADILFNDGTSSANIHLIVYDSQSG